MSEIEEIDDDDTDDVVPGQTEIIFEECKFYEETSFYNPLETTITPRLSVSYSSEQQFVMLIADNGAEINVRPETITKIYEFLQEKCNSQRSY